MHNQFWFTQQKYERRLLPGWEKEIEQAADDWPFSRPSVQFLRDFFQKTRLCSAAKDRQTVPGYISEDLEQLSAICK